MSTVDFVEDIVFVFFLLLYLQDGRERLTAKKWMIIFSSLVWRMFFFIELDTLTYGAKV